jgi:hypothetical protein
VVHAFESSGVDALLGVFPCPAKLSVWATLAAAQAGAPGQCFLANMCGVVSGMAYALVVAPGARGCQPPELPLPPFAAAAAAAAAAAVVPLRCAADAQQLAWRCFGYTCHLASIAPVMPCRLLG